MRALVACVAVLLAAGAGAAVTVDRKAQTTVVAGGRAGATSFGDAALLSEEPPAPAVTLAPVAPPTTVPRTTSTIKVPATSTTKASRGSPARRPPTPQICPTS